MKSSKPPLSEAASTASGSEHGSSSKRRSRGPVMAAKKKFEGGRQEDGNYKHTIELPQTGFGLRANSFVREPEIQKIWDENQGMVITENWIQRISMEVKKSPEEIREIIFQREGSVLHYGQKIEQSTLERLWNELKVSSDFLTARKEVELFNLQNRWRNRGIAIVPTKFGISFTAKFMNQAGTLVHVYTDGTVLVTHGGVEMGQGLHTKVAQIAASSFNIPLSSVFISETSTDKVPNASPTAASASSDLYGAAVLDACEQIKARMQPLASKNNFGSFAEDAMAHI